MRNGTRVAVVVPAYNAERYLLQSVQSALAQTMTALQLVIVDDGSSDNTLQIARSIQNESERIHVLSIRNGGPARARNAGVMAAIEAPYVAFLDADDLWDSGKLEIQMQFIEQHVNLVAVGSRMRYISPTGKRLGYTGTTLDDDSLRQVAAGRFFPFPLSSMVVRRSAFMELGGFDESFRYPGSEDLDFCARLAQLGPLQCVPRTLGSYRIHAESAMGRHRSRILLEARFVEHRIAERARGRDLTWDRFVASYRPSWGERRANWRHLFYRSAAVHHAEGHRLRAIGFAIAGLVVDPVGTVKRLVQQQTRGAPV